MKQYRTCEIDGCDKLARPYRYSTCWKHSAYGSLKEARRTKQKHRQMQAVPKIGIKSLVTPTDFPYNLTVTGWRF